MPISFSMPASIKELPTLASTFFFVPSDCMNVTETLESNCKWSYYHGNSKTILTYVLGIRRMALNVIPRQLRVHGLPCETVNLFKLLLSFVLLNDHNTQTFSALTKNITLSAYILPQSVTESRILSINLSQPACKQYYKYVIIWSLFTVTYIILPPLA